MRLPSFLLSVLLGTLPVPALAQGRATEDRDLLRFLNGDALHGTFEGMEDSTGVSWSGSSIKEPIVLQTPTLRRLSLNDGRARKALPHPEYIELQNGDQIPGRVVELSETRLSIDTSFGGTLSVERQFVSSISPRPHGGTLHYMGPFSDEGWELIERPTPNNADKESVTEQLRKKEAKPNDDGPWVFGGGAWYSNGQIPLAVDADIPDKARIAFRLSWRNRLSAVVAFHATLEVPELKVAQDENEGDDKDANKKPKPKITSTSSYPLTYGNSYVLTIYSSYAMLYRCQFDEDGHPKMNRLSSSNANIRLDESGEAHFELRCDRESQSITLFVDGEYVNQWEDPDGYAGTGTMLAFSCQNSSSRLRVSEVVVSSWNGMIDSARSMEADDRDTILLVNGTDRFSGHLTRLEGDKYVLQGTYAEMHIPASEVQEIRFARAAREELSKPSGKALRVVFRPIGKLTLDPASATAKQLQGHHPAFGALTIDLDYASLLEFSFSNSILDAWDEDFR